MSGKALSVHVCQSAKTKGAWRQDARKGTVPRYREIGILLSRNGSKTWDSLYPYARKGTVPARGLARTVPFLLRFHARGVGNER